MHLRSITMKGFKSFPDRTRLEFAPGVSVIVGPNGSGKSNVTDAVLWALGEQSPLVVRGQTMQDVIFSGAPGVPSRGAAEVEVVIDDSSFELGGEFSELSITRRLDRSGEGEYRMNGARCRLVDVLEALSDTGLGKEMHSVVSQGRVEGVIHSSPRDRRLLIEEAAGLGKHRKRRRRAELKLGHTQDNLARALDVEREARSRIRPLKRQAEAADLHARLERQSLEARLQLAGDDARRARANLAGAEAEASEASSRRDAAERRLEAVRSRREAAERAVEERARAREALAGRLFAATTAADRVDMRLERVREVAENAAADARRVQAELDRLEQGAARLGRPAAGPTAAATSAPGHEDEPSGARVARLEAELAALDAEPEERAGPDPADTELVRLRQERREAEQRRLAAGEALAETRRAQEAADAETASLRRVRREATAAAERARAEAARSAGELEAVEQLARASTPAPGGAGALARHLDVDPGYELALAAALGHRLRAGLASDAREAGALLDAASPGGSIVLEGAGRPARGTLPVPGAERLLDRVAPAPPARSAVERLLGDAWVVESLEALPDAFRGIAVTRSGRALDAAAGELRQAATGAEDALLEHLSRREDLAAAATAAAREAEEAEAAATAAARALAAGEETRERAAEELGAARRRLETAEDAARAAERAILRREAATDESRAVRRAELTAELRAERRAAERAEREREGVRRRVRRLGARLAGGDALRATAESAVPALEGAAEALAAHRESLRGELADREAAGSHTGQELRDCAREEAEVQGELRTAADLVTGAEVRAQRARDALAEVEQELSEIHDRLGVAPQRSSEGPAQGPLTGDERTELTGRVERLARRRERLGPVNPLAGHEYEEAVARVEELERQREDLETALAELEAIVREADRRIRERFDETFQATVRNFEAVVEELFPGGRGRLRLASPRRPSPVLGDEQMPEPAEPEPATDTPGGPRTDGPAAVTHAEADEQPDPGEPGVEVEVTPAGKSTRRLSLLSGGERALVALAFLFAVFLARPCPFYVLDEVEAALDDFNIDRFLRLVRRCSEQAQFIVVTHQKRTMDAADRLYGVTMGDDGISKVVSRRLPAPESAPADAPDHGAQAAA